MNTQIRTSTRTLVGVITPYAWDENDRVTEVSLSATDDEEYIIENGQRFMELIQKPIRATGIVKSGKKFHRAIQIKKFEMLEHTYLVDR
jgi:hypothetical protein